MMPPKGRKHRRILPPDVLSNLPDNVIDVILMCLPCKDAVRTSILSKKWRYNWCRLTELTVDESHWRTENDLRDPTVKFKKIICQFLTLHEGPITKFTLDIDDLRSYPNIDNFIYFLSRNDIQHLVLHLPWTEKLYKLPPSLFTCSQLRHLNLRNCSIHTPLAFQGFDRLISLELCDVTISSELLESLISHCPLLEHLVMNTTEILNIIEIKAPMLRSFDFEGNISSICLKNVPVLAKVSLIGEDSSAKEQNFDFAEFFDSCSALEHLVLDIFYTEFFTENEDEAPTRLPYDLSRVKRFYLHAIVLEESYKLSCALCLIRSFPYLEYLKIEGYRDGDGDILESLELEYFCDVTFNHLREVKLKHFTGTTPEMQLIKLLLAKSPVLVRMRISHVLHAQPLDARLKMLAKVSKFQRASPKAEVVYIKPLIE